METLIVEPKNRKQLIAIKSFLKALNVSFRKDDDSSINPSASGDKWFLDPENLSIVEKGMQDSKKGKTVRLTGDLKKELFG